VLWDATSCRNRSSTHALAGRGRGGEEEGKNRRVAGGGWALPMDEHVAARHSGECVTQRWAERLGCVLFAQPSPELQGLVLGNAPAGELVDIDGVEVEEVVEREVRHIRPCATSGRVK
jgi:hypothetical protein